MKKNSLVAALLIALSMALGGCGTSENASNSSKDKTSAAESSEITSESDADTTSVSEDTTADNSTDDTSSDSHTAPSGSAVSLDEFAKLLEKYGQTPVCGDVDHAYLYGSQPNLTAYGIECNTEGDSTLSIAYYTDMTPQFVEKAADMEYFDLMGDDTEIKGDTRHFKVDKEYPDKELNTTHELFKYYDGNVVIYIDFKGMSSDYPEWINDFAVEAGIWS